MEQNQASANPPKNGEEGLFINKSPELSFKWKEIEADVGKMENQVKIVIEGLDVYFPHQPYDIQIAYMSSVIQALNNSQNALLQSPTGTGKTLSLLCSTLAWLTQQRKSELETKEDITRIIYSTKTHSQIDQVVKELKKTVYKPSVSVLASRDFYCVKKEFMTKKGTALNSACNMARKIKSTDHRCTYIQALSLNGPGMYTENMGNRITDVEELRSEGRIKTFCPYFYSMKIKNTVDIVFLPYSYLLEYKTFSFLDLKFARDIIIFDEAHNVEKNSEEGYSFEVSISDLKESVKEIENLIEHIEKQNLKFVGGLKSLAELQYRSSINEARTIQKSQELFIDYLEDYVKKSNLFNIEEGITLSGDKVFEFIEEGTNSRKSNELFDNGFSLDVPSRYLALLLKLLEDMATLPNAKLDNWAIFVDLVASLYSKHRKIKRQGNHEDFYNDEINHYRLVIKVENEGSHNVLFQFWCFNPAIGFSRFGHEGARSLILTSGTLSPFNSFESELRLEFPIKLANPHVIDAQKSLLAAIVSKGPREVEFNFSFNNRGNEDMIRDLGEFLIQICKYIPNGVLVFFTSYPSLEQCDKVWLKGGTNSIHKRLDDVKTLIKEPRNSSSSEHLMNNYIRTANSIKGACLLAVCRGKFAEGIDFTDNLARAVVLVGIPYPPFKDPKITLKKSHIDKLKEYNFAREGSQFKRADVLNGIQWYKLQAIRALNQAIGRVIRHKNDFGAIYLCDSRFRNPDIKNHISGWVRENLEFHEHFGTVLTKTISFMKMDRPQDLPSILKRRPRDDEFDREKRIKVSDNKFGISKTKKLFENGEIEEETKEDSNKVPSDLNELLSSPINNRFEENSEEEARDTRLSSSNFFEKSKYMGTKEPSKKGNSLMNAMKKKPKEKSISTRADSQKDELVLSLEKGDITLHLNDNQIMEEIEIDGKKKVTIRSIRKQMRIQCVICLEEKENIANAKCGHIACMSCWESWLNTKLECPMCKQRVRMNLLTPLFLS